MVRPGKVGVMGCGLLQDNMGMAYNNTIVVNDYYCKTV